MNRTTSASHGGSDSPSHQNEIASTYPPDYAPKFEEDLHTPKSHQVEVHEGRAEVPVAEDPEQERTTVDMTVEDHLNRSDVISSSHEPDSGSEVAEGSIDASVPMPSESNQDVPEVFASIPSTQELDAPLDTSTSESLQDRAAYDDRVDTLTHDGANVDSDFVAREAPEDDVLNTMEEPHAVPEIAANDSSDSPMGVPEVEAIFEEEPTQDSQSEVSEMESEPLYAIVEDQTENEFGSSAEVDFVGADAVVEEPTEPEVISSPNAHIDDSVEPEAEDSPQPVQMEPPVAPEHDVPSYNDQELELELVISEEVRPGTADWTWNTNFYISNTIGSGQPQVLGSFVIGLLSVLWLIFHRRRPKPVPRCECLDVIQQRKATQLPSGFAPAAPQSAHADQHMDNIRHQMHAIHSELAHIREERDLIDRELLDSSTQILQTISEKIEMVSQIDGSFPHASFSSSDLLRELQSPEPLLTARYNKPAPLELSSPEDSPPGPHRK